MSLTRDRLGHSQRYPPIAAQEGHLEVVRLLLEAGADKDAADTGGLTALRIAAEHIGSLLKGLVKRVSGEAAAVLVGGMSTPATVHAAVRPQHCPYCHEPVVPSIDHVLWVCRLFAALRVLPRPVSDFTARLGWGPGMTLDSCLDLLQQMGNIRHEEHTLRRRTLQAACTLPEDSA